MICSHRAFAVALLISAGLLCQNTSAKTSAQKSTGKHYLLAANKNTVQWGWYDPTEKPRLVRRFWRHRIDRNPAPRHGRDQAGSYHRRNRQAASR
jgi:hypothetical protein